MTSRFRQYAAAALCSLGFALPASATTFGTDWTDLWFNPQESGWGINFSHQYNTLFATMFIYENDRSPHWVVASEMNGSGNAYSGGLYQTSGPGFSGPWTGGVTQTAVGSMSVNFTSIGTATLSYSVGATTVTKNIQRQTFRSNNLAGNWFGGLVGTTNCSPPNVLAHGPMEITHSNFQAGGTVRILLRFITNASHTCEFNGNYTALGKIGSITGTYSCTAGPTTGTFTMTELSANRNGFSAIYSARDNLNCSYSGFFGGTKDQFVQ